MATLIYHIVIGTTECSYYIATIINNKEITLSCEGIELNVEEIFLLFLLEITLKTVKTNKKYTNKIKVNFLLR